MFGMKTVQWLFSYSAHPKVEKKHFTSGYGACVKYEERLNTKARSDVDAEEF